MGKDSRDLSKVFESVPTNWGRWGAGDEVGSLNFLTPGEVLRGIQSVTSGKTFSLMIEICSAKGDPNWPGRMPSQHLMIQDKGSYESGKIPTLQGGVEYADDALFMACHGTTHCDALAHTWCDDLAWNGFKASQSKGGLDKASIAPIAEKGIVGRAVLLDVARYKGVPYMKMNEYITLDDLLQTARSQNVEIRKHDIIIVRTGILNMFFNEGADKFYSDFNEPGLAYQQEMIQWFHDMEIPVFATDTLGNEPLNCPTLEAILPIHAALSRNLGIVFIEVLDLEKWAADCEHDGKYDGLFMASPLKIVRGTASPVNPILVK